MSKDRNHGPSVGCLYAGIGTAQAGDFDLAIIELGLPDSSGLETLASFIRATDLPVVVRTGNELPDLAIQAVDIGASDYMVKDEVEADDIPSRLRWALKNRAKDDIIATMIRDKIKKLKRASHVGYAY